MTDTTLTTDVPRGTSTTDVPRGTSTPKAPGVGKRGNAGRPPGSRNRSTKAAEARAAEAGAASLPGAIAAAIPTPGPRGPGKPSNNTKLYESLTNLYVSTGAMTQAAGLALRQPRLIATGRALVENAGACAAALVAWADVNPKVKKALDSMATAGGAGLVIAAHAPIIMAAYMPTEGDDMAASMLAGLAGMFDPEAG